MCVIEYTVCTM